jgi:hypothetical protein
MKGWSNNESREREKGLVVTQLPFAAQLPNQRDKGNNADIESLASYPQHLVTVFLCSVRILQQKFDSKTYTCCKRIVLCKASL